MRKQTEQDGLILNLVLKYVKITKKVLNQEADEKCELTNTIDVSFSMHDNKKSYTGSTISLGLGSVHPRSVTYMIVTNISTEAQLGGLSDVVG